MGTPRFIVDYGKLKEVLTPDIDDRFRGLTIEYPFSVGLTEKPNRVLVLIYSIGPFDDPHGSDIVRPMQKWFNDGHSIAFSHRFAVAGPEATAGAHLITGYVKHRIEYQAIGDGLLYVTLRT